MLPIAVKPFNLWHRTRYLYFLVLVQRTSIEQLTIFSNCHSNLHSHANISTGNCTAHKILTNPWRCKPTIIGSTDLAGADRLHALSGI